MNEKQIVIVDDEEHALVSLRTALMTLRFSNVVSCVHVSQLWNVLKDGCAELVFLDLVMPGFSGEQILGKLGEEYPDVPVIMTTGVNDVETAVRCMRNGAADYLTKPIDRDELKTSVDRVVGRREPEGGDGASAPETADCFSHIITVDAAMTAIFRYIEAVAPSSRCILITGETGTGKELIAQAIHGISGRKGRFVPVNVAGLDEPVLADTLFGHAKGAFTGADSARAGMVESAAGGTLFLDEIGDLSPVSQMKLLRLLQESEYLPLGTDTVRRTDCRIVAATSRPVEQLKQSHEFRKDLFYRLSTHHIRVPSLKERKGDIPLLVKRFLRDASLEFGKTVPTPHDEIYRLLSAYHFPGNIRELRTMVFDAVAKHQGRMLSLSSFKNAIGISGEAGPAPQECGELRNIFAGLDRLPTFRSAGVELLKEAIKRTGGNRSLAARLLGVSQSAVSQRMKKQDTAAP